MCSQRHCANAVMQWLKNVNQRADGLIHVRMGPFNSRDDAERWRRKLLDDGYNAMIQ